MSRTFAWLVGGALLAGCAHGQKTPAQSEKSADLNGTWDWIVSASDEDNNKRVEQEEWHLRQMDGIIDGFYLRTVTVVSGDDNLFRCNGQKRFQKRIRFDVSGRVTGGEVMLRETNVDIEPGPCSAPLHALQTYRGRATGQSLTLIWDAEMATGARARGQQVLFRRPAEEPGRAEQVAQRPLEHSQEPPAAQIAGTWIW